MYNQALTTCKTTWKSPLMNIILIQFNSCSQQTLHQLNTSNSTNLLVITKPSPMFCKALCRLMFCIAVAKLCHQVNKNVKLAHKPSGAQLNSWPVSSDQAADGQQLSVSHAGSKINWKMGNKQGNQAHGFLTRVFISSKSSAVFTENEGPAPSTSHRSPTFYNSELKLQQMDIYYYTG